MMRNWIAGILALSCVDAARGQDFVTQYDGPDGMHDFGYRIKRTPDGGFVTIGESQFAVGDYDMNLVKFDGAGNLLWARHFAGAGGERDFAGSAAIDAAGNIFVGGFAVGAGGTSDLAVLKYASDGTLLWSQVWDGPGHGDDGTDFVNLALDSAGNAYLGGYADVGGGETDGVLLRLAAATGVVEWTKFLAGVPGGFDASWQVAVDDNDNVYVGSQTVTASGGGIAVQKYGPGGSLLWQTVRPPAPGAYDSLYAMEIDGQGNAYASGISSTATSDDDYLLIKIASNGAFLWERTYNGPINGSDIAFDLCVEANGTAIQTGMSEDSFDSSAATLMYDAQGNLQWAQRFTADDYWWGGDTSGVDVKVDGEGRVWVSGGGWVNPYVGTDGFLLCYTPAGGLLLTRWFDDALHANDDTFDLEFDDDGNLWQVGNTPSPTGTRDLALLRHDNPFLHLELSDNAVSAGDPLTIAVEPGKPGTLILLAVVAVNGSGFFAPILYAPFDGAGHWSISATVPNGLAGIEVTLKAYGYDSWSQLLGTNLEILAFE